LPTGSGKTTVFVSLLSRLLPPPTNENATRSLIIVNSIELARQSAEQVSRMFPHWTVEIEQGAKHVASGFSDVSVLWITLSLYALNSFFLHPEPSRHIKPSIENTGYKNSIPQIWKRSSLMRLIMLLLNRKYRLQERLTLNPYLSLVIELCCQGFTLISNTQIQTLLRSPHHTRYPSSVFQRHLDDTTV
jgi:hypothetical protein